ncbi:FMN-binding glutamate synthase family protein [Legionella sp. WA2022007384]
MRENGGLIILIVLFIALLVLFFWDIFQKKHTILRTYPIIGHVRYFAEWLGVYLRQFFYTHEREELPFNRFERAWAHEASKGIYPMEGFGSSRNRKPIGTIYFIDSPFPLLEKEVKISSITIGPQCPNPYTTKAFVNISAMSFGSLSKNAILALSNGAKLAGCWLNTGEGGLTEYHLAGECDLVAQIGTAKYGYRDDKGHLSEEKLRKASSYPQVKMFEIKLSQGAKPGKGGLLPAVKVTPEIAKIRGIPAYIDSASPNRFPEISNSKQLLNFIYKVRKITGKPTGFKVVLGDYTWLEELCQEIIKKGLDYAPDFITLDGAEGGTGAAPANLMGYMGLSLDESLPQLIDMLVEYDLRDRIKVIASEKLITPDKVAWAFCVGADIVNSARGFLFSLGCIQALRCHTDTCPTGIATHNKWLMRGLDPHNKAQRVFAYHKNLEEGVKMICHSCGVDEPRKLTRANARIVSEHGTSISLADVFPDKKKGIKLKNKKK